MSSQTSSLSDKNKNNLSEYEVLKAKYDALCKDHETLIETLEVVEKTHQDELNKMRESVVSKEEVEKWKNKFLDIEKRVEKLNEFIQEFIPPAAGAENVNVTSNAVVDEGVITISDDEEGNHGESNGGYCNLGIEEPEFSFVIRR